MKSMSFRHSEWLPSEAFKLEFEDGCNRNPYQIQWVLAVVHYRGCLHGNSNPLHEFGDLWVKVSC